MSASSSSSSALRALGIVLLVLGVLALAAGIVYLTVPTDKLPSFMGQIPAQFQAIFVEGFHRAFSIALGNAMWLGVGALAIASLSVALLHEQPLRQHFGEAVERPEERTGHPGEIAVSLD